MAIGFQFGAWTLQEILSLESLLYLTACKAKRPGGRLPRIPKGRGREGGARG